MAFARRGPPRDAGEGLPPGGFAVRGAGEGTAPLGGRVLPPGDGEGKEFYPLLAGTLAAWRERCPGPAGILRFEAELLDELGLLPHWEETPSARADLPGAVREAMERMRRGDGTLTALPKPVFVRMKDFLGSLLREAAPDSTPSRDLVFHLLSA